MYATGTTVASSSSLFPRSVRSPSPSSRQSVAFALVRSPSARASFASATLPARRDRLRARFAALSMGNKPRLVCIACSAAFKRASGPKSARCKMCRAKALAAGESLDDDFEATLIGFKRNDVVDASERANGIDVGGVAEGGVSKNASGGGGGKRRKKKAKKGASKPSARSDPICLEILDELDRTCVIIDRANAAEEMEKCLETLRAAPVIAVDCEGVMMSRTGPVTVLQFAAKDAIFLIDVQDLGRDAFGARGSNGLLDLLESEEQLKLMFDCRMDSDALFHQFDVRLGNVMDVQLLDIAARRSLGKMVERVSGIAKATDSHLTSAETAVAEDLKVRVKKLYSKDESDLWALRPFTDDVRRYAALDVWLLIKLYVKISFDLRDDKDDWVDRARNASAKRVLEFRELEVAVQQGVFTEENTVAPSFWYVSREMRAPRVPMMSKIA